MKFLSILLSSVFFLPAFMSLNVHKNAAPLLDECNGEPTTVVTSPGDDGLDSSTANISDSDLARINANQMRTFFYNLRTNFGYNQYGSCGYVALGMLLSYYDSYLNDELIPENYDQQAIMENMDEYTVVDSPGTNETSISSSNEEDYIFNLINTYSDSSFHANLVSIGDELGYGLGTTPNILEEVLIDYIEADNSINQLDLNVEKVVFDNFMELVPGEDYTYSEMMIEDIKEYVDMLL